MMPVRTVFPIESPLRQSTTKTVLPQNFHRRPPPIGPRLGQISTGREKAAFFGAGLINLVLLGTTAWVGITVGREKTGALSVAGWVTGIGAIMAGLYSLGVIGVETMKKTTTEAAA